VWVYVRTLYSITPYHWLGLGDDRSVKVRKRGSLLPNGMARVALMVMKH
jgi:hypothetical protein